MAVPVQQGSIFQTAHRQATTAAVQALAQFLQEVLSRRLTAYIVGVRDAKTVTRWATGEVTEVRDYTVEQRLRTSYEIAHILLSEESPQTVRAWFIGLNPQLGDVSPAEAINGGRLRETVAAARAFMVGG